MKAFTFPLTERQKRLVESSARVLVCGAGTKTGKSLGFYVWLIEGLLQGEPCCFCGPWFFRSRAAFDIIKNLLQPWIVARTVRVNEARLQVTAVGGGYIDFVSADNPDCLFGANYYRLVLDEASRMPEAIYPAALTTISATQGKLRLAFNLDLGVRNWAIRHLLRIQSLSPEERTKTGEDFLMFPTGGDGLVSQETIQQFKSQMPLATWEALYLARIPDSDSSLFRHLDKLFTGKELEKPDEGTTYLMGVDLARKADFSVVTIIDEHGNIVAMERFNQMDWSLQVGRVALIYRTFRCTKCIVDSTGVGDPVAEQLEGLELNVERFIFTIPSKKSLIEELVLACDNREIKIPATEKFNIYRQELESFEYILDGSSVKYAAPASMHDDCVVSLALATHAFRASRGAVLGVIEHIKRCAQEIIDGIRYPDGTPKRMPQREYAVRPSPVAALEARMDSHALAKKPNTPCPSCKSTCTILQSNGQCGLVLHCNQCGKNDGKDPVEQTGCESGCPGFLKQYAGGRVKCGNCGRYQDAAPTTVGMSFAQYNSSRRRRWG